MSRPKRNEVRIEEPFASIVAQLGKQQQDTLLEMLRGPALARLGTKTGIFDVETRQVIIQKKEIKEVQRTPTYRVFEVK